MLKLVLILLVMVPGFVFADTELSQDEILGVLKILTAKKTQGWITSGVISADHVEFRARKIDDPNEIEIEVVKAVKEHKEKAKTGNELEAVPFNTRYRLGNSFNMVSKEFVRVDGDKFYWQIEVDSREDSIKPNQIEKANHSIEYFLMGWNKLRVFAWDGEKYTKYFRPGNQAIITDDPLDANGPLTVGCIPWGIGKWSYEELQKCQLRATRTEKDEIVLNVVDDIFSMVIILNELQDYTLKTFERKIKLSGNMTAYNYGDYKKLSTGWVPKTVYVAEFEDQKLVSSDLWTDIIVDESTLSAEDFVVGYDVDAFIEDFRFGSEPLQYYYTPVIEPTANKLNTQDIIADKIKYLTQSSKMPSNCAIASIWLSSKRMGKEMLMKDISGMLPIVNGQSSLADMVKVFSSIDGVNAVAVNTDISDIVNLRDSQAILYFPAEKHFVNLLRVDSDEVYIADIDSNMLSYKISRSKLEEVWNGLALLICESNTILAKDFAILDSKEIAVIYGAGDCEECNQDIQAASETGSCYYFASTCSGEVTKTHERKGCGESSSGSCSTSLKISVEKIRCRIDSDNKCGATGATEILSEILACG